MANLNKVFLMGNLTRDPEVKYLPSQTAVAEFGIAVNRRWTNQDGQQKEEVTFVDCSAFGRTAETIGKFLKKGRPVFIEGRLKLDQWEAQDGSKRSKMRVVIDNFQFIDSGNRAQSVEGGEGGDEGGGGFNGGGGGGGSGGGAGAGGGGYAPRQPAARQPYRQPAGRPPAQSAPARPPADDIEQMRPADDEPGQPISNDDIPF